MLSSMSDESILRLIIALASLVLIFFILISWKFKSKPKPPYQYKARRVEPETQSDEILQTAVEIQPQKNNFQGRTV